MINYSLVCLLNNDKNGSFKTIRASTNPSIEKIKETYFKNVEVLQYILKFCHEHDIKSLRVVSGLFPLSTYAPYRDKLLPLLDEVGKEYAKLNYYGIELSSHPDQFILLSSLNENVNANSRYDLEQYAYMRKYIPWNLINIHVGSKVNGIDKHRKILSKEVNKLSKEAREIISLENDEKNYSFEDTLSIVEENGLMMVPDFHHERCYQKRKLTEETKKSLSLDEHIEINKNIDENIYNNIDRVFATYKNKDASPTFHISSPSQGWGDNFRDNCSHADYIDINDFPNKLVQISLEKQINCRLDIEAKAKNDAINNLKKALIV